MKEPREPKVKKGFTLKETTATRLDEAVSRTGHNQSKIVDAVLVFGLEYYTKEGIQVNIEVVSAVSESNVMLASEATETLLLEEATNLVSRAEADELVPELMTEIKPKKRQTLNVPSQATGKPSYTGQVAGGHLRTPETGQGYRPNMGQGAGELPPSTAPAQQGFTQEELDYIAQRLANVQQQQAPPGQAPPDPYQGQPPPPQQFAASYPPGYTGQPGVQAPAQPVPQQQPMYPPPQGNQPAYAQDNFSMNMADGVNRTQNAVSAQGLLSGTQPMTPLTGAQQNINLDIANRALGPNWRQNLRQIQAQDRRDR